MLKNEKKKMVGNFFIIFEGHSQEQDWNIRSDSGNNIKCELYKLLNLIPFCVISGAFSHKNWKKKNTCRISFCAKKTFYVL